MSYYAANQDPEKPLLVTSSMIRAHRTCEQRFAHRFISRTEEDADFNQPNWSGFGRSYHEMLETMRYDHRRFDVLMLKGIVEKNGLSFDSDGAKIATCIRGFFAGNLTLLGAIRPIGYEVLFKTDRNMGSIDAVFVDYTGQWWIVDNKTVGVKLDPGIRTKIISDVQMNMYAAHAKEIADEVNRRAHESDLAIDFDAPFVPIIDSKNFAGILYWEVEKPRQRHKEGEKFREFLSRIPDVVFRSTAVRKEELNNDIIKEIHSATSALHTFQSRMKTGEVQPVKNRSACVEFHSPCPYYSQCFGVTYSYSKNQTSDAVSIGASVSTDALDLF